MPNVLPPGTPRAWVEAQETGQTVRGYEPGVPLPEEDLTPPHILAERMVRRMERRMADGPDGGLQYRRLEQHLKFGSRRVR